MEENALVGVGGTRAGQQAQSFMCPCGTARGALEWRVGRTARTNSSPWAMISTRYNIIGCDQVKWASLRTGKPNNAAPRCRKEETWRNDRSEATFYGQNDVVTRIPGNEDLSNKTGVARHTIRS